MTIAFEHFYRLSQDEMARGQSALALDFLEKAMEYAETESERKDALKLRASHYDEMGESDRAEKDFRTVLDMDENDAGAIYGLAMLHYRKGEWEEAEAGYLHCLEVDPTYDRAAFFLADTYDRLGDADRAIRYYRKTIALSPNDHMAYNNLGSIYEIIGENHEAMLLFNKSIEIEPMYFRPYFNLGVVFGKMKQYNRAHACYEISNRLAPGRVTYYLNRSALYIEEKKFVDSLRILAAGIEANPDAVKLYYQRACVLQKLGNVDLSLADLAHAARILPEVASWAEGDKDFDGVRSHPTYVAMLARAAKEDESVLHPTFDDTIVEQSTEQKSKNTEKI